MRCGDPAAKWKAIIEFLPLLASAMQVYSIETITSAHEAIEGGINSPLGCMGISIAIAIRNVGWGLGTLAMVIEHYTDKRSISSQPQLEATAVSLACRNSHSAIERAFHRS